MQCFLVMPDMHLCIYKVLLGMKKTILVTGSTGVIGLSISQFFYKKGFNVIINGKCKPSQLRDVKKKTRALHEPQEGLLIGAGVRYQ